MATSRLIPMHLNKGKTIAQCLADRIDYSKNPDKTNNGEYVTSYCCNASIADAEFLYSKRQYDAITGRTQKNNVIAYQMRQSFSPVKSRRSWRTKSPTTSPCDSRRVIMLLSSAPIQTKSILTRTLFSTPRRWTAQRVLRNESA